MNSEMHIKHISAPAVVIGAGPGGLTAAYEFCRCGTIPIVLEKADQVGGIARTEVYKGYRFDIGGHRFFTKIDEVEALWHQVLGDRLRLVPRLSRIYYQNKFYNYPLNILNTLSNLGMIESFKILFSYIKAQLGRKPRVEENLEQWVTNRFGERLYRMFFKTYTEKVWGLPCDQIQADWAAQRIKGLSLQKAVLNALTGSSQETSLIDKFYYPVLGPGEMWEQFHSDIEKQGGEVRLGAEVVRLRGDGRRIKSIVVRQDEIDYEVVSDHFINSMPLPHLIERIEPPPPTAVLQAAKQLSYRDFLIVALVLDREDVFPDNWIYIHSPEVQVGRIQNFKNWSPALVPDMSKTCLGMEYFCTKGDGLWESTDEELIRLATQELEQIGLSEGAQVIDATVVRQPMAYPVYDASYRQYVEVIKKYLGTIENLQSVGRGGMHRYNNQDHSMLTAILAVQNVLGANHDLWEVNVERSYHEAFTVAEQRLRSESSVLVNGAGGGQQGVPKEISCQG